MFEDKQSSLFSQKFNKEKVLKEDDMTTHFFSLCSSVRYTLAVKELVEAGKPYCRRRLSTIDLLVLTSLDYLFLY
jgi:hypothetical protein